MIDTTITAWRLLFVDLHQTLPYIKKYNTQRHHCQRLLLLLLFNKSYPYRLIFKVNDELHTTRTTLKCIELNVQWEETVNTKTLRLLNNSRQIIKI